VKSACLSLEKESLEKELRREMARNSPSLDPFLLFSSVSSFSSVS